jgi:signal transduction histidine kinase
MLVLLTFPGLIWAAVRLRDRGATLAVALASGVVVWATTHFVGPFPSHSMARSVLEAQLFILVAAFATLCLAAAVTERETLMRRLSASRLRVIQAADAERRRLEHNLHDGAQQLLTGIAVRLGLAAEELERSPVAADAMIKVAQSELGVAIDELRQLAHGNHPAILIKQGLAAAVRRMADRSSAHVDVVELPATRLDPTIEATAYYVLAESVANAQKYSAASFVRLRAEISRGTLQLEVLDDGRGGAVETPGSGLEGLRDRVEALDGEFEVTSSPGVGTRVVAAIPLTAPRS